MKPSLAQRTFAECLGTAFLLAAVVGSGIMAARLAGGNGALALLCNTLSDWSNTDRFNSHAGSHIWRTLQSGGKRGNGAARRVGRTLDRNLHLRAG